jgi:hypothetical protein
MATALSSEGRAAGGRARPPKRREPVQAMTVMEKGFWKIRKRRSRGPKAEEREEDR